MKVLSERGLKGGEQEARVTQQRSEQRRYDDHKPGTVPCSRSSWYITIGSIEAGVQSGSCVEVAWSLLHCRRSMSLVTCDSAHR